MATEKVNPIEFDYGDKHFTLYFTRKSIQRMEQQDGFDITKADVKMASTAFELFAGAFYANHRNVTLQEKERMFDRIAKKSNRADGDEKETLTQRLMKLYQYALTSLLEGEDDDEDSENLIIWS